MHSTPAAIDCSLGSVEEADEVAGSQQPTPPAIGQGPEGDPQTEGDKAAEAAAEKSDADAHTVGVTACPPLLGSC